MIADSLADFAAVQEQGQVLLDAAVKRLVEQVPARAGSRAGGLVVFNPLGWKRSGLVEIPWSKERENESTQVIGQDGEKKLLVEVADVPALGYLVYVSGYAYSRGTNGDTEAQQESGPLHIGCDRLENRFYRLELNSVGQITSLYDKLNRRGVLAGPANVLQIFEDRPLKGDARDIDLFYLENMRVANQLLHIQVEETSPIREILRLEWGVGQSKITQRLTIYRSQFGIDFRTEIDWHEHQILLKAVFSVSVRATQATYNIQFGTIERPIHWNTSHDLAHFENPAQKWVDLSEGNYGVALLNDCKYDYDVKDNVLRISLHRSPTDPDPNADQGQHTFTYRLLPHAGPWRDFSEETDVTREAYALNDPLWAMVLDGETAAGNEHPAVAGCGQPDAFSFAEADQDFVVIETVKKAEDTDAWIVRLYEAKQCRGPVALTFGLPVKRAVECSLLEEEEGEIEVEGQQVRLALTPYEIKTLMVWF